jgi:hypothetical protein
MIKRFNACPTKAVQAGLMILEVVCNNFTIQRSVWQQAAVSTYQPSYPIFSAISRTNCAATGQIHHFAARVSIFFVINATKKIFAIIFMYRCSKTLS